MTKEFASYTKTVRMMIRGFNVELYDLFCDQNIEEVWAYHDGWNGGIDYYDIVISVPVELFESLRNRNVVEETEDKLLGCYSDAMRGEDGSIQLRNVILKPTAEDVSTFGENVDDSMWQPGCFRLFISHLSVNKESASNLKCCLANYGIDCFVAHEDITPSKEWEIEIEKALFTMDALCAIVVSDFIKSQWCDQEVGIALGQRKLVIAVNKGSVPYGFFGKYQALKSKNKNANALAADVWTAISINEKTKTSYLNKLVSLILNATDKSEALQYIDVLKRCENVNKQFIEHLHENFGKNSVLNTPNIIDSVNPLFRKYGLAPIELVPYKKEQIDYEELPF